MTISSGDRDSLLSRQLEEEQCFLANESRDEVHDVQHDDAHPPSDVLALHLWLTRLRGRTLLDLSPVVAPAAALLPPLQLEKQEDEEDVEEDDDDVPYALALVFSDVSSTEQYELYRPSVRHDDAGKHDANGGNGGAPPDDDVFFEVFFNGCSGLAGGVGAPRRVMDIFRFCNHERLVKQSSSFAGGHADTLDPHDICDVTSTLGACDREREGESGDGETDSEYERREKREKKCTPYFLRESDLIFHSKSNHYHSESHSVFMKDQLLPSQRLHYSTAAACVTLCSL